MNTNKLAHNRANLAGNTYGKLTVTSVAQSKSQYGTTVGYWNCECECGTTTVVPAGNLISGNTTSCGCHRSTSIKKAAESNFKHGHNMRNSPTYRSWQAMRQRVASKYAHLGIKCDPRWDDFSTFLADMGERPDGQTLDRINPEGNYTPSNCRWATPLEQGNNRRNNLTITHDGRTQTVSQWAKELGLARQVLAYRLKKWPLERAMKPLHP